MIVNGHVGKHPTLLHVRDERERLDDCRVVIGEEGRTGGEGLIEDEDLLERRARPSNALIICKTEPKSRPATACAMRAAVGG
jgi:hypothetical protein